MRRERKSAALTPKFRLKIAVDAAMTLALLFLMGYQLWGEAAHEWVGVGMFVLFVWHQLLNRSWYSGIFRGKYTPFRIFRLVLNAAVFASMLGLMASGIMLSNHAFAFLDIHSGLSVARMAHMVASYWGFVLMALHLGAHWGMFIALGRKFFRVDGSSRARGAVLFLAGAATAFYGVSAFLKRDLATYMFARAQFVFLDFGEAPLLFYLDYIAMMAECIFLAHYSRRLLAEPGARGGKLIRKERSI